METSAEDRMVVQADILNGDIIITFSDGRFARYGAALLWSMFGQAEELHGTLEDERRDRKDGGTHTQDSINAAAPETAADPNA
jgi:hypothetical protein